MSFIIHDFIFVPNYTITHAPNLKLDAVFVFEGIEVITLAVVEVSTTVVDSSFFQLMEKRQYSV